MSLQRTLRTLAWFRGSAAAVTLLAVIIAAGLLLGPARFGPGERSAEAALINEVKKLLASDIDVFAAFSRHAASISGDTIVVGAFHEATGGTQAGAAYVFRRDQGGPENWGEVQKLTASDAEAGDRFGFSTAISADTIFVGADQEDAAASNAGAVYIFERDEGGTNNWGEVKKLTSSDAHIGDSFGRSVAVSGDIAVVGERFEDAGSSPAGVAYLFQRNEGGVGNWGEVKKLTASDAEVGDNFGQSVAVSGDTVVVGAQREDAGGSNAGAAYVFRRDQGGPGNWGEVKKVTASDAEADDEFSFHAVAVSGDTAVVGAHWEGQVGSNGVGAAYIFQRDEGGADNWGEVQKLTASDADLGDHFGERVAISGGTAVVGAHFAGGGTFGTGGAYAFQRNEGGADNWGEVTKLTASDIDAGDDFGDSVAVSGDTVVVGATLEDEAGTNAGAAYVFSGLCLDFDGDTLCDVDDPDDDNDGCTDVAEQQPKSEAASGGGRDPHYYWDFMDMWVNKQKDRRVNIVDIGAIVQRLFTAGDPGGDPLDPPQALTGYHASADRSAPIGPNLWNAGPPDGDINIIEIGLTVAQFLHDCN